MIISVRVKDTTDEVYRYNADAVIDWPAFPVATYDHVEIPEISDNPTPVKKIWEPPFEFMRRFTSEERVAIRVAAKTDILIDDFLDLCKTAPSIHSDDPDLLAAMGYFVQLNLITAERMEAILNG